MAFLCHFTHLNYITAQLQLYCTALMQNSGKPIIYASLFNIMVANEKNPEKQTEQKLN